MFYYWLLALSKLFLHVAEHIFTWHISEFNNNVAYVKKDKFFPFKLGKWLLIAKGNDSKMGNLKGLNYFLKYVALSFDKSFYFYGFIETKLTVFSFMFSWSVAIEDWVVVKLVKNGLGGNDKLLICMGSK